MPPVTPEEEIDYDYKKMYRGRKCFISLDSALLHDYEQLKEFETPECYLEDYRNSGFDESQWDHPETLMQEYTVQSSKTMCENCPHSEENCDPSLGRKYQLPLEQKKTYASCPLEKNHIRGTKFVLYYPRPEACICEHCGNLVRRKETKEQSTPEYYDLRFCGHPGKLLVQRQKATCPYCNERLQAVLIPSLQENATLKMTKRLIEAIGEHLRIMGIADPPQKNISQGYGISDETMRKYFEKSSAKKTAEEEKKKIKQIRAEQKERKGEILHGTGKGTESLTLSFAQCSTWDYSMTLCFSSKNYSKRDMVLTSAFDQKEINVMQKWMKGEFREDFPWKTSEDHLVILAYYYVSMALPHINDVLAFDLAELVIAYRSFLRNGRGAPENAALTREFRNCLEGLEAGTTTLKQLAVMADYIYDWSSAYRKSRIAKAALKVLTFLDRTAKMWIKEDKTVAEFEPKESAPIEVQNEANRIGKLIEQELMENTAEYSQQNERDTGYETDSSLAILRLLYINPLAAPEADEGPNSYRLGIPIPRLEAMLQDGLLDNYGMGRRRTNSPETDPPQNNGN